MSTTQTQTILHRLRNLLPWVVAALLATYRAESTRACDPCLADPCQDLCWEGLDPPCECESEIDPTWHGCCDQDNGRWQCQPPSAQPAPTCTVHITESSAFGVFKPSSFPDNTVFARLDPAGDTLYANFTPAQWAARCGIVVQLDDKDKIPNCRHCSIITEYFS